MSRQDRRPYLIRNDGAHREGEGGLELRDAPAELLPLSNPLVQDTAQAAIHAELDPHPKVTLHDYPGLDHGFAAETGNRRDEAGATLADSRTEAFFAEHLA